MEKILEHVLVIPVTNGDIEFTPEAIQEHLDGLIEFWRNKRKAAVNSHKRHLIASTYIDCLQTIRMNIFGKTKS